MLISSTYFGNIAFWSKIAQEKSITIDYSEYYEKQTYRNRTEILTANGLQTLSIPVIRPNGKQSKMSEILISNAEDWKKNHWKAIESAYKHAPYFWYYGSKIKALISSTEITLVDFNERILLQTCSWLDLDIEFNQYLEYIPLNENDPRLILNKKHQNFEHEKYIQVFEDKFPFKHNLSILDALFNVGPIARKLLIPN